MKPCGLLCLTLAVASLVAASLVTASGPIDLDWTLGHWEGTRTDAGDGSAAPMHLMVEALPGGLGTIERIEVATDGDPYVGFTTRTLDPITGTWTAVYGNDVRRRFARMVAAGEGDRVLWNSITVAAPRASRLVSEHPEPDRWRRTQEYSDDGGATWQVRFVDELRRTQ